MTLWAGFISVLGYCSLLFAVVWLSHCCSCNKVINLVMTQDSLFLLEKASDKHRQQIGFSPLPATKWSNFGTADCLLQRTWVNYWRSLSTKEGFPAPPVQKGQQELLSPSDTSFQMVPWLCCPLPSTQCLELQLKSVLALSMWTVAPSSENHFSCVLKRGQREGNANCREVLNIRIPGLCSLWFGSKCSPEQKNSHKPSASHGKAGVCSDRQWNWSEMVRDALVLRVPNSE